MKLLGRGSGKGPDLWVECGGCKRMLHRRREFEQNLHVCPRCNWHGRIGVFQRLEILLDEGTEFEQVGQDLVTGDPLGFKRGDLSYGDHLASYRERTGLSEAAVAGRGSISGRPIALALIDFRFLGASMGTVVGERVALAIELAEAEQIPLLICSCSGGARMQEGMLSLMQMAKTAAALERFGRGGGLYISLMTDPTLAGVTASFASLADVIVAEPGATVGFTGRRLIEQIAKQKLPDDAQSAEFMQKRGMIDLVVPRRAQRSTIIGLLELLAPQQQIAAEATA